MVVRCSLFKKKLIVDGWKQNRVLELRITNYELRIMNYES